MPPDTVALFPNPYGYYDAATHEYVITRPDTPTPWINYLGAGRYGGIVSNTGGGYSFDRDPRYRRVTRYRYNGVPADQPGRYIYLRDMEAGDYWSVTWQPVTARRPDHYECRHGPGHTRIETTQAGITASLRYFVPPGADTCGEVWVLRVRNTRPTPCRLRSFSYVEFGYWDAVVDQQNLDWGMHIVRSVAREGTIHISTQFRPTTSFFSSNAPIAGYDTDREVFLGCCRDLSNPEVVEEGEPTNQGSPRGNSIGSLCHELSLAPGEEREIIYLSGVADKSEQIEAFLARYRDPAQVQSAFQVLQADWQDYLDPLTVETPDTAVNAMESAHDKLNTPDGFALMWPAYRAGSERVRGTATFPPGAKENGGIFCHAHAWAIIAAARLGWAERALTYYHQLLPLTRTDVERAAVEPYVYCQNICGPEHSQFGRGRNSWLTGTAAWTYVAATQYILGIRPTFAGLEIDPVIPVSWEGFSARRRFRGIVYHITVRRTGPGNSISMEVDDRPVAGNIVPFPTDGQCEVSIRVTLA
jgi:cellobiose phosphorylase